MTERRPGRPNGPLVSIEERLLRRREVDPITGCWCWAAHVDRNGYGRLTVDGVSRYAHRVMWELENRTPVPDGLVLDHLCENRGCFNPAHLEPVTMAENTNRRRNAPATRTHCPQGHRYAGDNLRVYIDANGYKHRQCVTCNRIRSHMYRNAD